MSDFQPLIRRVRSTGPGRLVRSTGSNPALPTLPSPPPGPLPLVSVVVACFGQLEYTKGLVASLNQNAGCAYELILVDNGCPDRTADWAESHGARAIRMGRNVGVPGAYNAGFRAAQGGIIALWNNDMLCLPGGLERLARWSLAKGLASQGGGVFGSDGRYVMETSAREWADYAAGYCLAFTRAVWDKVGDWDTGFFPSYSDDADWTIRARLNGFDFVLVPGCVTHFGQKTSGAMDLREVVVRHQQIIAARYLSKGLGQRLLVRRWAATGDVLMTTPALRALKAGTPLARLHVETHPGPGAVLSGLPYVDWTTHERQDRNRYTRVVDLDDVYESPQKQGVYEHPALAFCRAAGVEYDGQPYDLRLTDEERAYAEALTGQLSEFRLVGAGVRSGTRDKQSWNAAGWLELAAQFGDRERLVVLDSATRPPLSRNGDARSAADFYDHPRVVDLTGRTRTFREAAAVLERCQAFVGVDSGLLHAASALGKPVVNICAAAPQRARTPLTGRAAAFEGKADCFPCQYATPCPTGFHCLDWVRAREVAKALFEIVE